MFTLLVFSSLVKEIKAILKHFTNFEYCIAYRNNIANQRNVQTHQGPDEDTSKVQVNITEDNKDLNVNQESENELHEVQSTLRN